MSRVARVVSFSAPPEFTDALDAMARREGRTRSELIREAVRRYEPMVATATSVAREAAGVYAPPSSFPGLARVLQRRADISALCKHHGVERLWLFGSAVRDDFEPGRSDFDFQVRFMAHRGKGPWLRELRELEAELSQILEASVDLSLDGPGRNPFVNAAIAEERVSIYEQA